MFHNNPDPTSTLHEVLLKLFRLYMDGQIDRATDQMYQAIEQAIDRGADLNAFIARTNKSSFTRYSETPLHYAVYVNDSRLVSLFLNKAPQLLDVADKNSDDTSIVRNTPLALALFHDNHEIAQQILESGADPNKMLYGQTGEKCFTPLEIASRSLIGNRRIDPGLIYLIKLMIHKGGDIDLKSDDSISVRDRLIAHKEKNQNFVSIVDDILNYADHKSNFQLYLQPKTNEDKQRELQLNKARRAQQRQLAAKKEERKLQNNNNERTERQADYSANPLSVSTNSIFAESVNAVDDLLSSTQQRGNQAPIGDVDKRRELQEKKEKRIKQRQLAETKEQRQIQQRQNQQIENLIEKIDIHIVKLKARVFYPERRADKIELLTVAKQFLHGEVNQEEFERAKSRYPKWDKGKDSVVVALVSEVLQLKGIEPGRVYHNSNNRR